MSSGIKAKSKKPKHNSGIEGIVAEEIHHFVRYCYLLIFCDKKSAQYINAKRYFEKLRVARIESQNSKAKPQSEEHFSVNLFYFYLHWSENFFKWDEKAKSFYVWSFVTGQLFPSMMLNPKYENFELNASSKEVEICEKVYKLLFGREINESMNAYEESKDLKGQSDERLLIFSKFLGKIWLSKNGKPTSAKIMSEKISASKNISMIRDNKNPTPLGLKILDSLLHNLNYIFKGLVQKELSTVPDPGLSQDWVAKKINCPLLFDPLFPSENRSIAWHYLEMATAGKATPVN